MNTTSIKTLIVQEGFVEVEVTEEHGGYDLFFFPPNDEHEEYNSEHILVFTYSVQYIIDAINSTKKILGVKNLEIKSNHSIDVFIPPGLRSHNGAIHGKTLVIIPNQKQTPIAPVQGFICTTCHYEWLDWFYGDEKYLKIPYSMIETQCEACLCKDAGKGIIFG